MWEIMCEFQLGKRSSWVWLPLFKSYSHRKKEKERDKKEDKERGISESSDKEEKGEFSNENTKLSNIL